MGARCAMGSVCVWKSWNIEHRVHSHTDTHDVSSTSAPAAASDATDPPKDNDQARKTTEHGEQRGDGVDAVDPGDPARSGGATNRLNTRRNSQSKWSKEKRLRVSSPSRPERQCRASAQPAWACSRPQFSLAWAGDVPHRLSTPPPRLLAARGCPRKPRHTTPWPGARPRRHSAHSSRMPLAQPQRQMQVRMMAGWPAGRRRISPGTRCDSVCAPTLAAPIATTACGDKQSVSASWLERTDRGRSWAGMRGSRPPVVAAARGEVRRA